MNRIIGQVSKIVLTISPQRILLGFFLILFLLLKDLAVFKLDRRLDRPAVTFARSRTVNDADNVYVLGFPGAADNQQIVNELSQFEVKVSRGIISAKNIGKKIIQKMQSVSS